MRANNINIVICLNAEVSEGADLWLRDNVQRIIFRDNIGYDFGAYKDCVKYLHDDGAPIKQFMLLNDSVFFIDNGLEQFFARMMSDCDAVSAFENWGDNAGNHFQSFAVSVSGKVFHSEPFQSFWQQYVPVSSRIWAIEQGEKKLSEAVLKIATTSKVLYTCADLCRELAALPDDLVLTDVVVPLRYRGMLPVDDRRSFNIATRYPNLVDIVNNSSPIHCGAWLFPNFLRAPLVKKDIVYRQRFQFWEVQFLFKDLMSEEEFTEFSTQLRAKGNYEKLDAKTLTKYELGIA